ncbi:TrkA family potassium uptake protein [Paenibacillus albiflavus]|uniref:TrkA family potassium uptake protein n=1 Tax=Paenibacillus albiflavus TaxID=2545760 RepID=A0A4R4ECZ0_9BACL|nr:TrkA family potassium uptake protein [Paenibacillus albiflavus]TCZ75828.1 TrkA family potassium uptake protein [Paenibacillus albiflavus]
MIEKQYAVIGLGRFGSSLSRELVKLGYEVLGIDINEERVHEMSQVLTHTVVADCTEEEVLRSLGIRNFDCVVVAIGNDMQASILTAIVLKDAGVTKVVAKALSELHGKVLQKIGVDRVIYPERDMGIRVAHQLVSPNLLDYIELSDDYTIAELSVPQKMCGNTLHDMNPRAKYGCSVVAIIKKSGVIVAPSATDMLEMDDLMVVIGKNDGIEKFEDDLERSS